MRIRTSAVALLLGAAALASCSEVPSLSRIAPPRAAAAPAAPRFDTFQQSTCYKNPNYTPIAGDKLACIEVTGQTSLVLNGPPGWVECKGYTTNGGEAWISRDFSTSNTSRVKIADDPNIFGREDVTPLTPSASPWDTRVTCTGTGGDFYTTAWGYITVNVAPNTGVAARIALGAGTTSVRATRTLQVTPTVWDTYNNIIPNKPLSWSSSNPGVATVDANGLVTGVAPGTVSISASADGVVSPPLTVTVLAAPALTSISVSPGSATIAAGQTVTITATPRDQDGNPIATGAASWATSAPDVATVSSTGALTASVSPVNGGTAQITATINGVVSKTSTITVNIRRVTQVVLTASASSLYVGQMFSTTLTPYDQWGAAWPEKVSSATAPFSPYYSGSFTGGWTAVNYGSATMTATIDGVASNTVALTIRPALSIAIQGPSSFSSAGTYTWSAYVANCTGTCTYQWYRRPSGDNTWAPLGTAQTQNVSVNTSTPTFDLKLTVSASDGQSRSTQTTITNGNTGCTGFTCIQD